MPGTNKKLEESRSKQEVAAGAGAQARHAGAAHEAPAGVQALEPEDAYLTGAGHEQQRGLLEKNVAVRGKGRPAAQPVPDTSAGQHATGSSTGETKK